LLGILKLVSSDRIFSGVSFHPAVVLTPSNATVLANNAKVPILVVASLGEPADYKEGGIYESTIKQKNFGSKSIIKSYNESHGFVPRGNLSVASTAVTVHEAINLSINLFKVILQSRRQQPPQVPLNP
jgi:hypothetical protein